MSVAAPSADPVPDAPPPRRRRPRLRGRLPRGLIACALIALVHAGVWAFVTPIFQTPDETAHLGYAQYLAETGKVPRPEGLYGQPAPDMLHVATHVPLTIVGRANWSRSADERLRGALATDPGSVSERGATYAANNPPLYYALAAGAYHLGGWGDLLDRIMLMRLLSAVLAALTVAFVFAFVRELLPSTPWAWPVGALVVAFQPVFAFMGGGVNNDNLVYTAGAALLWLLARSFRHGLTLPRAAGLGLVLCAGLLAKGSTYGLLPGTAVALAVMAHRAGRAQWRRSLAAFGLCFGVALVPFAAWIAYGALAAGRTAATASSGFSAGVLSVRGGLSYVWQFWLPRPGFLQDWFAKGHPEYPVWDTYIRAFAGRFGWFHFRFAPAVEWSALGVYLGVLALAARELVRRRAALWARIGELFSYACLLGGLALLVNVAGYRYRVTTELDFEQVRYLFPLLGLWGALVALAARAGGRRWGPALGALFVTLAVGHSLASLVLSLGHFYA